MPAIRGLVVSVGPWYADTLRVCLPANMRHLTSCLVVTAPGDPSIEVARSAPGVDVFETDAFTQHGARFNKGLAIEQAFEVLGRSGWIAVIDADILWPEALPWHRLRDGCCNGARRRILDDPSQYRPDLDWRTLPDSRDGGPIGFTQIFHADDPMIRDKRPWYDVSFAHAGGCDAYFLHHWPRTRWNVMPVEVLHLGPKDRHWFGTEPESIDMMGAFVARNGWRHAAKRHDPTAIERVGEIPHRVQVPGYAPSTYEMPFVSRRTRTP